MIITKELLEKAKTAKTAEELLEMAKAENVEMTAEEAAKYFADLHKSGELSDEELDNVAGGCGSDSGKAKSPEQVKYLYPVGKYVEVLKFTGGTKAANIIERRIKRFDGYYYPEYKVRYRSDQSEEWVAQYQIQD